MKSGPFSLKECAWQPMETAPKDGTEILLCLDYGIRIGAWVETLDSSHPFVWGDQDHSTLVRPWKNDPEPKGWMPLPEPME